MTAEAGRTEISGRQLLDALGGFNLVVNRELEVLQVGAPLREALGDALGLPCYGVLHGRDEPCPDCPARAVLESRQRVLGAELTPTTGGGTTVVPVTAAPVLADDGTIVAVVLTELAGGGTGRPTEAAHERACATLFEEVPCYIAVIDEDFHLLRVNRKARDDFGDPADVLGVHCYELFKRRREPCLNCPTAATFREGSSRTSEETVITRNGEPRQVLVITTPLLDAEGETSRVMEMATDITEIRHMQSQLEALGMLVGRIAHDIKGVLTGLDGGVYMVSTGMERRDQDRLDRGWQMVRRNVDRIRTLALDILYYAKDREPDCRLASPIKVLDTVLARLEPRAKEAGVSVQRDVDPEAIRFEVDVRAVEALLTNLADNALDACRIDEREDGHTVRMAVRDGAEEVLFVVEDNGVGMDSEGRAKAFTPFFSSKGSSGTGLGLYIAHRIAVQHGGGIDLDSELGRGTTFTVHLPKHSHRARAKPA
ncbi:MAG: PAS domain-containing sensor histidine kinase [Acidobacteria bacterium]|nr:PAS domain-containing sensor histidine kinase [Acidobacteriota bacterium]